MAKSGSLLANCIVFTVLGTSLQLAVSDPDEHVEGFKPADHTNFAALQPGEPGALKDPETLKDAVKLPSMDVQTDGKCSKPTISPDPCHVEGTGFECRTFDLGGGVSQVRGVISDKTPVTVTTTMMSGSGRPYNGSTWNPYGISNPIIIYYTIDDTVPTHQAPVYQKAFNLAVGNRQVVGAITTRNAMIDSAAHTVIYKVMPKIDCPAPDPSSGTFVVTKDFPWTVGPAGAIDADILYTINGTDPTRKGADTKRTKHGAIMTLGVGTHVIRTMGIKEDWFDSDVCEWTLIIIPKMPPPLILPGGPICVDVMANISVPGHPDCPGPICQIYYTTSCKEGAPMESTACADPTDTSPEYALPFKMVASDNPQYVKAFAVKKGYADSDTATKEFLVKAKVADPMSHPNGGVISINMETRLFTTESYIPTYYYTMDNSTPTYASATLNPFFFPKVAEYPLKFFAVVDGMCDSEIVEKPFKVL